MSRLRVDPHRRLRVLTLTADYEPGNWSGIGVAVASQAQSLAAIGAHVEVLSAAPGTVPGLHRGVKAHRLSSERCGVRLDDFDILHLHSLGLAELASQMCRRSRLCLVYSAHSLVEEELSAAPHAALWAALQRRLCRLAARVVFVSQAERVRALHLYPELAPKASVVLNGLEAPSFSSPRRDRDPPRPTILFVGRFSERKGLALLERVLPELVRSERAHVRLVGGHGDRAGDACVERLRSTLGDACEVVGWCSRERLASFYAEAQLLLVPSEYEPFGLVALEAMQHGCPVLASATGGLAENVTADSGGLLVPPGDAQRWVDDARRLLRDPTLRRALASRGPTYVRKHFCPLAIARRLASEIYLPALRGASPPVPAPLGGRASAFEEPAPRLERGMQTWL